MGNMVTWWKIVHSMYTYKNMCGHGYVHMHVYYTYIITHTDEALHSLCLFQIH